MHIEHIDAILKYALAVAAESDEFFDRQLGPIHLIKYVYLGDVAYAERHEGQTFTGIPWRFHHYGPWAAEVFHRIEPVVAGLGCHEERFSSSEYERDFVRYRLDPEGDGDRLGMLEMNLPAEVASGVKRAVQEFSKDTTGLLNRVYLTRPMLRAAPGEFLDFSSVASEPVAASSEPASTEPSSKKAEKRREAGIRDLRERIQQRMGERRARRRRVEPDPPPRYDDVFAEGQRWLDAIAGEPLPDEELEVRFSDDIWHSRGRSETELP